MNRKYRVIEASMGYDLLDPDRNIVSDDTDWHVCQDVSNRPCNSFAEFVEKLRDELSIDEWYLESNLKALLAYDFVLRFNDSERSCFSPLLPSEPVLSDEAVDLWCKAELSIPDRSDSEVRNAKL
jgi:hypothetical protein